MEANVSWPSKSPTSDVLEIPANFLPAGDIIVQDLQEADLGFHEEPVVRFAYEKFVLQHPRRHL